MADAFTNDAIDIFGFDPTLPEVVNNTGSWDVATSYGYDANTVVGSPVSGGWSSTDWKNLFGSVQSLGSTAANAFAIIKGANTKTAGYYDVAGAYHPVNGNGVGANTSGAAIITPSSSGLSGTLASTFNVIFAYLKVALPWVIGGLVIFFAFKIFRKIK
jgi:hypothetical protein